MIILAGDVLHHQPTPLWEAALICATVVIHLAVIARAMLVEGREAQSRASWLILLIALPVAGIALYVLFGEPWMTARFRRSVASSADGLARFAPAARADQRNRIAAHNAFATCEAASGWAPSFGNFARVAPDSDAAIAMIAADIDAARHTVHLSFYIWLDDHNGGSVAAAICRAAARGVTCRIVADAVGSRSFIRSAHWAAMRAAGAHLCESLRVPPGLAFLAGHRIDLRNHRKIVVVDDQVTYCGSQNCADPAFLIKRQFGPWVDILIRYEGPLARQANLIFAAVWMTETAEDLRPFFAGLPGVLDTADEVRPGGFAAIAVGTGPLSARGTMSDIFIACLAEARQSVTITTPYFAPDAPLFGALLAAARRGVVLTIVFPHRNDSRIVGAISRAYYPLLAEAGARIFEFKGGLLHAKTLVVDTRLALVGSANMDRRSLDLNFENNVLFECAATAGEVITHQSRWLANSVPIDRKRAVNRSLPRRLVDNLLTLVGPLF